jgi:hypothetical protein
MMPRPSMPEPPAAWRLLVSLMTQPGQAGPILGDLAEEFTAIARESGNRAARRWYRRQAAKTALELLASEFRSASWAIATVAFGSYMLLLGSVQLVELVTGLLLEKFPIYTYIDASRFWWLYAVCLQCIVCPVLAGWMAGWLAGRRVMPVAVALSAVSVVMGTNIPAGGGLIRLPVILLEADRISHYLPHANILLFALSAIKLAWLPPLGVLVGAALRRGALSERTRIA